MGLARAAATTASVEPLAPIKRADAKSSAGVALCLAPAVGSAPLVLLVLFAAVLLTDALAGSVTKWEFSSSASSAERYDGGGRFLPDSPLSSVPNSAAAAQLAVLAFCNPAEGH